MTKAWHYGIPRCLSGLVLGFIEDLLKSNVYAAISLCTVTEKIEFFPFDMIHNLHKTKTSIHDMDMNISKQAHSIDFIRMSDRDSTRGLV